jgi:hypothetical protein
VNGRQRAPEQDTACPILGGRAGGENVEGRVAVVGEASCPNDERSVETVARYVIAERAPLGGRVTRRRGDDAAVAELDAHHLER